MPSDTRRRRTGRCFANRRRDRLEQFAGRSLARWGERCTRCPWLLLLSHNLCALTLPYAINPEEPDRLSAWVGLKRGIRAGSGSKRLGWVARWESGYAPRRPPYLPQAPTAAPTPPWWAVGLPPTPKCTEA